MTVTKYEPYLLKFMKENQMTNQAQPLSQAQSDALMDRIDNDFGYHPATSFTGPKHEEVRATLKDAAFRLVTLCPPSRELSLALTALEEAMHWGNAAIAKQAPLG